MKFKFLLFYLCIAFITKPVHRLTAQIQGLIDKIVS